MKLSLATSVKYLLFYFQVYVLEHRGRKNGSMWSALYIGYEGTSVMPFSIQFQFIRGPMKHKPLCPSECQKCFIPLQFT